MAANTSINLTSLDFDTIKDNFKTYMKAQDLFKDYDFDASNINVLLDILAHNTHLNSFYLNMIGNEMFLDTALMRDSVVSHAKELNYIPRSFRSAQAIVNIVMVDSSDEAILLIPRGTSFTGTVDNKNFTFTVSENIQAISGNDGKFYSNNVTLYEGDYVSDQYVMNYSNDNQRFIINNKTVDINSLLVTVLEDNGAETLTYKKADNLFGLNATSQSFFIQAAENETYEVLFGDGVIGRRPKDRSIIILQYRRCNGELPNGIGKFSADGKVGTSTITSITTVSKAAGGSISESISSIKFNAPRAFNTQERVVTASDYETILKANFSEINAVSAYGGEEETPPQYGKVIVAVDLKTTDELPPSRRNVYRQFIKQRSPLAIDPVFITPDYTYVLVNSKVKYNINETSLSTEDIKALVISTIQNHNTQNIDGFNKTLRYSRLIADIDDSDLSIVSNDTDLLAIKSINPNTISTANYDIDFSIRLKDDIGQLSGDHPENEQSIISSTPFFIGGSECFIEDDGEGMLRIMSTDGNTHRVYSEIGTVDYARGFLQLSAFKPDQIIGNNLDIYARTEEKDITSQRRTILAIRDQDIKVSVTQVRL